MAAVRAVLQRHAASLHLDVSGEPSGQGLLPLHVASQAGHAAVVAALLDVGADPDAVALGEWTPLLLAAGHNHAALARLLLARGAAVDAATRDGSTALHLTAQFGHAGVAEALLELGASPSARTADHASALHIAAENGHEGVVRALLRQRRDAGRVGRRNRQPGRRQLWTAGRCRRGGIPRRSAARRLR